MMPKSVMQTDRSLFSSNSIGKLTPTWWRLFQSLGAGGGGRGIVFRTAEDEFSLVRKKSHLFKRRQVEKYALRISVIDFDDHTSAINLPTNNAISEMMHRCYNGRRSLQWIFCEEFVFLRAFRPNRSQNSVISSHLNFYSRPKIPWVKLEVDICVILL